MDCRKSFVVLLMLAAAFFSGGCRQTPSLYGHSCGMFAVPMYKQPAGYSGSYSRHLAMSALVIEQAAAPLDDGAHESVVPSTGDSSKPRCRDDKVIIPEPCGPICRQRAGDEQPR